MANAKSASSTTTNEERFKCIECGFPAQQLFHKFDDRVIKMEYCINCQQVVDKYVEHDAVLILLDALLHKPQAYRHVLLNMHVKSTWKLLLIFLLCDTYLKWDGLHRFREEQDVEDHIFYAAIETDFYQMFGLSIIEWLVYCATAAGLLAILSFWHGASTGQVLGHGDPYKYRLKYLLDGLTLSSFGKLLAVPAIIWGQSDSAVYLTFARIFLVTSNVTAFRVLFNLSSWRSTFIVVFANAVQFAIGQILLNWLDS